MAPRFVSPMIRQRPKPATNEPTPTAPTTSAPTANAPTPVVEAPTEEPEESALIASGTFRQARDYSLVLLSQGIVHTFIHTEEGPFEIRVVPEHKEKALYQIQQYIRENPPKKDNPPMPLTISAQPIWVLLVPVACTLADFGNFVASLHNKGLSDAYKVLHGEWWRTITALTLHADTHHLAANLVSGYIVLNLLAYRIPLARMAPFLAIASALANFCVALTVQSDFRALGFSTFVFAVIGALAVIEFRLMPKETHGMLRRFAPLCGAISIAVFLGLGEHADILGHAYGFIAGMLCGLIPKKKMLRWGTPTAPKDIVWIIAYFAIFIMGWKLALA